jgi:hypothetical protein
MTFRANQAKPTKPPSRVARVLAPLLAPALAPVLGLAVLTAAPSAEACGGLFCNSTTPVTQAAERILFARDGATMHMVVRLTYQGPPIDFGWLLPVPADVQTLIAGPGVFGFFDSTLSPEFQLRTEIDPICAELAARRRAAEDLSEAGVCCDESSNGGGEGGEGGGDGGGPSVQVLERVQVGPYDQAVLRADNVEVLRVWLTENGYQFPAGSEPLLQSYIDLGSAFLALKLVADADEDDVVPLHLQFTSDTPAIPLRPTAVAADPDMGILVHLLGNGRAVPLNFPHVTINDAAINWGQFPSNYVDVVSQAIDEAGGLGFVTDAAQAPGNIQFPVPSDATLVAVGRATTLADLAATGLDLRSDEILSVVKRHATVAAGTTLERLLSCSNCDFTLQNTPVDGEALVEDLERSVLGSRRILARLFAENTTVTRLFTTMSAHEMTVDPIFGFNPDLPEVSPRRTATQHISCDGFGELDLDNVVIELADGRTVGSGDDAPVFIQRQDGLTVRGEDTVAAAVVERMYLAGQPEIIDDRRPALNAADQPAIPRRAKNGGCGCDVNADPAPTGALAGVLLLLGLRRRSRPRA